MQTAEEKKLYNELIKEVKRANQRLIRLESEFGVEKWAAKKLRNRLDTEVVKAWTSSSRIRLNKSMNLVQLRAVHKAVTNFLNSKTSTISGIKKTIARIKKSFKKELDITEEEAEAIYEAFDEDLLKWIFQYIEPSEFWNLIQEAKEYHFVEDRFIEEIKAIIDFGNDLDVTEKLQKIYKRYVFDEL